jgi:hypothetical protein
MKQAAKIQCIHPEGKHAPAIAMDTYALFEKAIYHALKGKKQGLTFTQLTDEVGKCFKQQKIKFPGSVGWYAVAVKNHMESTGVIKTSTVKGSKMHTLA